MTELTIENVEEIKKGYITGFYDAEGSISIDKYYVLRVIINQAYKPVLEKINQEFKTVSGIKVHSNEGYDKRGVHHKGAWCWRLNSNDALKFLEYVHTYSIEKRAQIELGIKYQKMITPVYARSKGFSQREIQLREWFKNKIEELKHVTPTEEDLKSYENEIKKQIIPKSVRDGKQKVLSISEDKMYADMDEIYKRFGIDTIEQTNTQTIPKMPNYIELGYLAGFFDGEAYIGISKGKRDSYTLRVAITNTNFDMLKMYETKFGGKIRKTQKDGDHCKDKYQWNIDIHEALPFLKFIQPFTIVKRKQIDLAIEFQEWHNQIKIIKTPEQKKKAEWYYNSIMDMKKETGEAIQNIYEEPEENTQETQKSLNSL